MNDPPSDLAVTWDRMIFRCREAVVTKQIVHTDDAMTRMQEPRQDSSAQRFETFGAQTPIALMGLAAIAVIALVNIQARPASVPVPTVLASACVECGTVTAIRRSAHSSPVYFVEIQMLDGSTRVVQQLATGFKVGDLVQVNGNALSLRPQSS
jgi:hypothetical protein